MCTREGLEEAGGARSGVTDGFDRCDSSGASRQGCSKAAVRTRREVLQRVCP